MKHWKTVAQFSAYKDADKKRKNVKKSGKEVRVRKRSSGFDVRVVVHEDESTFKVHTISGKSRKSFLNNKSKMSMTSDLLDGVDTEAVTVSTKAPKVEAAPKKEKTAEVATEKRRQKAETRQARRKRLKKEAASV